MRTIKFRAWDGEQMVSPDYIDRAGNGFWKADSIPTSTDILMQFTGLHDKNGREIYEGDVVSIPGNNVRAVIAYEEDQGGYYAQLKTEAGFVMSAKIDSAHKRGVEAIGNIYENPELLTCLSPDSAKG